jgi:hypothetical protein
MRVCHDGYAGIIVRKPINPQIKTKGVVIKIAMATL